MSLKRKLIALGYQQAEANFDDQKQFRLVIKWLEETKIQQLTRNERIALGNIDAVNWIALFEKYISQLHCPIAGPNQIQVLNWLLGYALKIEYPKDKNNYNKFCVDDLQKTNVPNVIADNPLDHLDYSSKEFKEGINNIAHTLNISSHLDPLVTLEACSKLIRKRLHVKAINNPVEYIVKGTPFPYQDADLGFDLKNAQLNEAAKVLRLLYIQDLRDLQTKANECIVAVQNFTQNPKTDAKIGMVGK